MRARSSIVAIVVGAVLLVLVAAAYAVDSSRSDKIAKGVRIDGVPVGGLKAPQARAAVESELLPKLQKPVFAVYRGRRFELTARTAGVQANVDAMVSQALDSSRHGWFVGRSLDAVLGRSLNLDLSPQVGYSSSAVDGFVAHVAKILDHPPQDAQISFDTGYPKVVREQSGVTVQREDLRGAVAAALAGSGSRNVPVHVSLAPAKLTAAQLPGRYASFVIIDRPQFQLRLYKRLHLVKTYPVAIGMQGLETPAGVYHVQWKEVDPPWHVPNDSWAGSLAGQTIPPGPQDPIKARWIGFNGGAGIHGTDDTGSIGTAGSHGCVRMLIPDVIELYPQLKEGDVVAVV